MIKDYIFTSESVTEGHPDKMADGISDAVLDAMLEQDPHSRVACETMITTGMVVLAGEITSKSNVDFQEVVRKKVLDIGYDDSAKGFDGNTCSVLVSLDKQSPDIAQGVNQGEGSYKEQGAGDQGLMFGYAVNETKSYMPLTIDLSHQLSKRLTDVRKTGVIPELRPDGKTQVSAEYADGVLKRIEAIVVSSQHSENFSLKQVQESIREEVINKTVPAELMDEKTKIYINPTGKFVIGGPMGDCGLTGRKIIVDTYGGAAPHGGGAFSGKDPTKVDRSAAYAARYLAKNIVSSGVSDKCLIQLAYAIGVSKPLSIFIKLASGDDLKVEKINKIINKNFDLSPRGIREMLKLNKPIYEVTSAYGHFGRKPNDNGEFSWEKTDKADLFKL